MPISLMLAWFGVSGPQNEDPNLGVSLKNKVGTKEPILNLNK